MSKKNTRSVHMTEQELENVLSHNKNLKIASSTPLKNKVAAMDSVATGTTKEIKAKKKETPAAELQDFLKKPKKKKEAQLHEFFQSEKENTETKAPKKKLGIKVKENIIEVNKTASIHTHHSEDHLSIIFEGGRLLSVNQIFSILQYRKYEVFAYKKMWQELILKALTPLKDLPFFERDCEIILLRQSAKLVDTDALSVMFKYIIDALKEDKKEPTKPAVLSEDNPEVVHNIRFIQSKGKENFVGIRVQRSIQTEEKFNTERFLLNKKL